MSDTNNAAPNDGGNRKAAMDFMKLMLGMALAILVVVGAMQLLKMLF